MRSGYVPPLPNAFLTMNSNVDPSDPAANCPARAWQGARGRVAAFRLASQRVRGRGFVLADGAGGGRGGKVQRLHLDDHGRPGGGQRRAGPRREAHEAAALRLPATGGEPRAQGRARAVHRRERQALKRIVTGRTAARIKESIERFVVVGSLRLERLVPGAYAWRPAPRARGGSAGNA